MTYLREGCKVPWLLLENADRFPFVHGRGTLSQLEKWSVTADGKPILETTTASPEEGKEDEARKEEAEEEAEEEEVA